MHAHCKKQGKNCNHRLGACREIQMFKVNRGFVNGLCLDAQQ